MGVSEFIAITLQVPFNDVQDLKEMLQEYPSVRMFKRGWILSTVAIVGPPAAIRELKPKIEAWQQDCFSRDAW